MTDQEYKNVDAFVIELRKMSQTIYLACDAEVAADVCLKTTKAINIINELMIENNKLKT